MSSSLNDLVRLLDEIVAAGGSDGTIRESVEELYVSGVVDQSAALALQNALASLRAAGLSDSVVINRFGDTVPLESVGNLTKRIQVRLLKPNTETTFYFYGALGLRGFFASDAAVSAARTVLVARHIEPFSTLQCVYLRWDDALVADRDPSPGLPEIEVRRLVVDLTGHVRVPTFVGNLLLPVGARPPESPALQEWRRYAARSLPTVLVNEVRATDTGDVLALSVPRRVSVSAPATEPDDGLFQLELDAARWVYAGGAGIENRHTFFTTELSRAWRTATSWDVGFRESGELALESARSAERLFASGKTGDVLKALGDLRKAINEDVAKFAQQTRDLGSGLWRDVAIAVGALAAKAATTASANPVVGNSVGALLVGIAVFLGYSLRVTLRSNKQFLDIADSTREKWTRQTYGFLSDADMRDLASDPTEKAKEAYEWTVTRVIRVYVAVIVALLLAASSPLLQAAGRRIQDPTAASSSTPASPGARATTLLQRAQHR